MAPHDSALHANGRMPSQDEHTQPKGNASERYGNANHQSNHGVLLYDVSVYGMLPLPAALNGTLAGLLAVFNSLALLCSGACYWQHRLELPNRYNLTVDIQTIPAVFVQ